MVNFYINWSQFLIPAITRKLILLVEAETFLNILIKFKPCVILCNGKKYTHSRICGKVPLKRYFMKMNLWRY